MALELFRRWLGGADRGPAAATARWAVVALETSAPEAGAGDLLSIAGVAVVGERLRPEDSFELIVHQDAPGGRERILAPQAGVQRRLEGVPVAEALREFRAWLAEAPTVGFDSAHDTQALTRAFQKHRGERFEPEGLDLALLAPALYPDEATRCTGLDEWLHRFGIAAVHPGSAPGEAVAVAELLLRLLPAARERQMHTVGDLLRTARGGRRRVS